MVSQVNEWLVGNASRLIEAGWTPDWAARAGIRKLCRQRLEQLEPQRIAMDGQRQRVTDQFLATLQDSPIAIATQDANQQHYELPPAFFEAFLGPRRKYSGCYWPETVKNLADAEVASLQQVCERGQLRDGMEVLELGCGWGSLSLWILEHFPKCRVTAVSNSAPQRQHITQVAESRGWSDQLQVITADMNEFEPEGQRFDRVFSLEMLEHMRNHRSLLARIRDWLREDGLMFAHVFCHREVPYLFDSEGASNWMGRYFFTGGMMPNYDLLGSFPMLFEVQQRWQVNGQHYARTLDAWLERFDQNRDTIDPILDQVYGPEQRTRWRNRWRIFLMACSELFQYGGGEEWFVGHYLMRPVPAS